MRKRIFFSSIRYLLLLLVLLALFLAAPSFWILLAAGMAVAAVPLSLLWIRMTGKGMEAQVLVPAVLGKNKEEEGKVIIRNKHGLPSGKMYVTLTIMNELTGEENRVMLPLEKEQKNYCAFVRFGSGHCGKITVKPDRISIMDLFGMIPVHFFIKAQNTVTVLPETFPLDADDISAIGHSDESDLGRDDIRGNDMNEVFQLRGYIPGDRLQGIHWKLSSKLDQILFRDPGDDVDRSLLLYWDQSSGDPEEKDAVAEVIFSIGLALTEAGVLYSLGRNVSGEDLIEEISGEDALFEKFPDLLKCTAPEAPDPDQLLGFGRVFYFTASPPEFKTDSITFFVCGEAVEQGVSFTPENYRKILERHIFTE